ncbi:MAG: ornithine cyclodeaminase family protein [Thermomicrobiales bacterium]
MLALSRTDLKSLIPMKDAVELMKLAFRELSAGRAQAPVRSVLTVNDDPSAMLMMPGYVPENGALGFKTVNFFAGNPKRGLPTIHAIVCLIDPETGIPLAIMEGGFVTALRTGAVSGAASDLMALPDSRTLVVIGAGVQGVTQAAAVCAVRPIERIIAVDVSGDQLARFEASLTEEWPEVDAEVETTTDTGAAVRQADIICTATTARSAVFADADLKPGTHINAVGAFTPEMQEVPIATCGRARIVVDNHEAVLEEAGDLLKAMAAGAITKDDLKLELGHVVDNPALGRTDDREITFFKSVGNAVQDVVVARYAVDQANVRGSGQDITLL